MIPPVRISLQALAAFGQAWMLGVLSFAGVPAWPQFRGPNGSGVAEEARPPVHFGPQTNLAWKVSVPPGISAPIVWGNRAFLTGVDGSKLVTLAYDASTGRELWRRAAPQVPLERSHAFSSPAAPTACTDGERVYSYFGSFGLMAHDVSGREVWRRALPTLPSDYGTATSPILAGGHLILQHDGDSTNASLMAINPATGEVVWKTPRPLAGASYSTPMVWRHEGVDELMVLGKGRLTAYGLEDGIPQWWVRGWGFSAVTTPVASDTLLFVGGSGSGDPSEPDDPLFDWKKLISDLDSNRDGNLSVAEVPASLVWHIRKDVDRSAPGNSLALRDLLSRYTDTDKDGVVTKAEWDADEASVKDKFNADRFVAVRPGARDDGTVTHVEWETTKGLPEMPSAILYRGRLGLIRDGGLWTVMDPSTGKRLLDRVRVGAIGQYVASPVAANGFIYMVNESGTVSVLRAGDTLDVVAVNAVGESVRATPALAGRQLIVRGVGHLWCFAQRDP